MAQVTFTPTEAMQVTLRPRVFKVELGPIGFQGPQGTPGTDGTNGTAAATGYTYAGLPSPGTPGRFARVTDGTKGLYFDTGTAWSRIGPTVRGKDFGVVFSTI